MLKNKNTSRKTSKILEDFKELTQEAQKLCLQSFDEIREGMKKSNGKFSKTQERIKKEIEDHGKQTSGFIV